jgi:hypothetical protein
MARDLKMDDAEIAEIVEYLNRWAAGTENDAPFLVMMPRTLTPDEFASEVQDGTPLGDAFLSYISEQPGAVTRDPSISCIRPSWQTACDEAHQRKSRRAHSGEQL